MKIAIVNTARNYGGQEAMAVLLSRELRSRGHDVLFLCRPVFPALDRIDDGIEVETGLTGIDWDPRGILRSRSALKRHGSRVLLATTNKDMRSAALAAASLDVPVVVRRAMARPLRDVLHYRILYGRLPAHIVVNSEATLRIMLESAPWVSSERTSVVYNGIDGRAFSEAEPADLGVPEGSLAIGFVGRFVEWKGVMTVAEAWPKVAAALPDAHLVLVGEGEMEEEMRARLDGTERVAWTGFRHDIPAVMQALDVLAYPSTMEGFGLAAAEAMAARLPVVGANACALPEVIEDGGTGILVPPRDPTALADALVRLGRDGGLREEMGSRGRERVRRRFARSRMVDEYEACLRTVANGRDRLAEAR